MPIVRNKRIEILFSAEDIAKRNKEIAETIATGNMKNILVIAILKGSFVFAADLIRAFYDAGISVEMEFITISSYGAGTSSGELKVLRDIESDVKGRDVMLVDDILESGNTLSYAKELVLSRGANRVEVVALLNKPARKKAEIDAEHIGFECPDQFVVGYGMDAGHAFRELPFVGVVTGDVE